MGELFLPFVFRSSCMGRPLFPTEAGTRCSGIQELLCHRPVEAEVEMPHWICMYSLRHDSDDFDPDDSTSERLQMILFRSEFGRLCDVNVRRRLVTNACSFWSSLTSRCPALSAEPIDPESLPESAVPRHVSRIGSGVSVGPKRCPGSVVSRSVRSDARSPERSSVFLCS